MRRFMNVHGNVKYALESETLDVYADIHAHTRCIVDKRSEKRNRYIESETDRCKLGPAS